MIRALLALLVLLLDWRRYPARSWPVEGGEGRGD